MKTNIIATLFAVAVASATGCDDSMYDESMYSDPNEPVDLADVLLEEGEIGHLPWNDGSGTFNMPYEVQDGLVMSGGDMVLGTVAEVRLRLTTSFAAMPSSDIAGWPGNVVPYQIPPSFSNTMKTRINEAIDQWNETSVFYFRPKQAGEHALVFQEHSPMSDPKCRAEVGYQWWKSNTTIWLADADNRRCSPAAVVHEIGHALGLKHEHQRSDRDLYVSIVENAIRPGRESDFAKGFYAFGPYDYTSLMHYGPTVAGKATRSRGWMTTILVNGCDDSSDPGCTVGRQKDASGDPIITDLDRAGVMRANDGSANFAFQLQNTSTLRCLRASSQSYVLAGNNVSTTSNCSGSSTRRWYQKSRPAQSDKVLVNRSGRVCLSSDNSISVQNCDDNSSIAFTMSPLGSSRYQLRQGNRCLRESGGSLYLANSCGTSNSYVWRKLSP